MTKRSTWNARDALALALLTAGIFACYAPALGYEFVYDDRLLILKNPQLLSWSFVPAFFRESFVAAVLPNAPANYYRPVLLLWMLINQKLWGLSPAGWHFSAIVLHALVTFLVYALARRLLSGRPAAALPSGRQEPRFAAFVAAAVFAFHPIHVECVAWVMGMTESLVAFFVIASMLAWLEACSGPALDPDGLAAAHRPRLRSGWLAGSLVLFALATLSKENALVLPGLIMAYAWLNAPPAAGLGAWIRRAVASLQAAAPHLAVAAAYFAARLLVLKGMTHPTGLPLSTVLRTLPLVLERYLILLLWPAPLSLFYDVPYVHHLGLENFVLPLAAVLAAVFVLWQWGRRSRPAAFAAVWLGLPILPVLDLAVFPHGEIVHDRYLYLPSVGLGLLVALAIGGLTAHAGHEPADKPATRPAWWRVGVASALVLVLAALTGRYRRFWTDNLTLYERGVEIAPLNNRVAVDLANELVARHEYDPALALYHRVLARAPDYWLALYNLGYADCLMGRFAEAEVVLQKAIAINPLPPHEFLYLGLAETKLGHLDLAEHLIRQAIALRPAGRGFHFALGVVLRDQGHFQQALEAFRAELTYHPNQPEAWKQIEEIQAELKIATAKRP